jgi:hypothetical protein
MPATCPYPEPALSSPYPHILLPADPYNSSTHFPKIGLQQPAMYAAYVSARFLDATRNWKNKFEFELYHTIVHSTNTVTTDLYSLPPNKNRVHITLCGYMFRLDQLYCDDDNKPEHPTIRCKMQVHVSYCLKGNSIDCWHWEFSPDGGRRDSGGGMLLSASQNGAASQKMVVFGAKNILNENFTDQDCKWCR